VTPRVRFGSGTQDAAHAVAFRDGVLDVRGARPFAPGTPVPFEIDLASDDEAGDTRSLSGKVIGCKRNAAGGFDLRLRLVSLRREEREALVRVLPPEPR
jgi:hypothetical protein